MCYVENLMENIESPTRATLSLRPRHRRRRKVVFYGVVGSTVHDLIFRTRSSSKQKQKVVSRKKTTWVISPCKQSRKNIINTNTVKRTCTGFGHYLLSFCFHCCHLTTMKIKWYYMCFWNSQVPIYQSGSNHRKHLSSPIIWWVPIKL